MLVKIPTYTPLVNVSDPFVFISAWQTLTGRLIAPCQTVATLVPFSFPFLYAAEVIMDLVFCFKTGIRREWVFFKRLHGVEFGWILIRFSMKRKYIAFFAHYLTPHILLSLFCHYFPHPYMNGKKPILFYVPFYFESNHLKVL